jgi:hypothetical protein
MRAQSDAIRGHQTPHIVTLMRAQSDAIRGHQTPHIVTLMKTQSDAIRGHQTPHIVTLMRAHSEVIRGHQGPSEVINSPQRSSVIISGSHPAAGEEDRLAWRPQTILEVLKDDAQPSPNHLLVARGQGRAGSDGVTSAHLWGRGGGAVVSTCMLEPVPMASRAFTSRSRAALPLRRSSTSTYLWGRGHGAMVSTCMLACSASFEAVEHEHVPAMHSEALKGTQMHSDALRCNQMHSDARFVALACTIRCTQMQSEELRCTIRSTSVYNQMHSDALRCTPMHDS